MNLAMLDESWRTVPSPKSSHFSLHDWSDLSYHLSQSRSHKEMLSTPAILKISQPIGVTKESTPTNTERFNAPRLGPTSTKTRSYRLCNNDNSWLFQFVLRAPPTSPAPKL